MNVLKSRLQSTIRAYQRVRQATTSNSPTPTIGFFVAVFTGRSYLYRNIIVTAHAFRV